MSKIQMTTPLVEMDGDEMTRILWKMIKDELLLPFIDLKTEYYDLGLEYRNETNDQVTVDSANATLKYGVAVKCATITPNAARMTEYNLKEMWKSPNGTIRAILDGTVFRTPIVVKGIEPCVKNWKKPITLARHAYGDVYKNTEMKIAGPGKAELVFTAEDGTETRELIHNFTGAGVLQGMHNTDKSITSFARACFSYALDLKQDLWFATKDTISKKYDHTFKDIFAEVYENEYKAKFEEAGITYLRCGSKSHESRGRLYLGMQELRRRCNVRYGFFRVRFPRHDDFRTGFPERRIRIRSRTRNRTASLLQALKGRGNLHKLCSYHFCMDRSIEKARRVRRHK